MKHLNIQIAIIVLCLYYLFSTGGVFIYSASCSHNHSKKYSLITEPAACNHGGDGATISEAEKVCECCKHIPYDAVSQSQTDCCSSSSQFVQLKLTFDLPNLKSDLDKPESLCLILRKDAFEAEDTEGISSHLIDRPPTLLSGRKLITSLHQNKFSPEHAA